MSTGKKSLDVDYTMIRRCMAIVLNPFHDEESNHGETLGTCSRTRTNSTTSLGPEVGNGISEGPGPPDASKYPGPRVFQSFVKENSECYWNPCLVQSVRNLEYRGCVAPCTLLVSGTEYSLEVVRSAWARRMLRAPLGYDISMLGDLDPVKMNVVAQTQFAPLPEALCKVVYDLNSEVNVATMSAIGTRLRATFPEIVLPNEDVLYAALGTLIRERKLFHTGKGYSVVTPETFRLLAMSPPLERQMLLTNEEAILRLHGMAVTEGQTACTQTNQREGALTAWSSVERILSPRSSGRNHQQQGKLKRCHSLKLLQRCRDKEKLSRSNSFRSSKASPARDAKSDAENLDPAVKKEKSSMFSKWFRRAREKKSSAKSSTASSQFPPRDRSDPDFVLYNSRATQTLEDQKDDRLPPKPTKTRSRSLNRVTHKERQSYTLTPTTPKLSHRSSRNSQTWDDFHCRSSSLPRKSSPSRKAESLRQINQMNRKLSPKPTPRLRQNPKDSSDSKVPSNNFFKDRSPYESSFSPVTKRNELLVKPDDKYGDSNYGVVRKTTSVFPNRSIHPSTLSGKPIESVFLRNRAPPWRFTSSPMTFMDAKRDSGEPFKPVPIGLPQRITREVASVSPSTAPVANTPANNTITENVVRTETTSKKGVQIDGTVDVEINLRKLLSDQQKSGLNTDLEGFSKGETLKIAASWNQSLNKNQNPSSPGIKSGSNQILSTTTSVKTSVSHGRTKDADSKTVEVNCPVTPQAPIKVLKSTTVVDCTGKCTIVTGTPMNANNSGFSSPRSKMADAKRDFFAESPSPTEPTSLKDDSGFSSSASTSRPMSVSPC